MSQNENITTNSVKQLPINSIKCSVFNRKKCLIYTVLTSLIIILVILLSVDVFPVKTTSFFCNDPSINKPFIKQTIGTTVLTAVIIIIALIIHIIDAFFYSKHYNSLNKTHFLFFLCESYIIWLIWFGIHVVMMSSLKLMVGFPRPHFMDVCDPRECKSSSTTNIVMSFTCTNSRNYKSSILSDSFLSFPSGHSSTAIYAGISLSILVELMILNKRIFGKTCKLCIQFGLMLLAFYVCSTRITENYHHPSDVAFGALLGLLYALFYYKNIINFRRK